MKYDTTAPTVTVVRPQVYDDDRNLVPQTATAGHPFTVNVTFSEPVTGFETSDITASSNATVTSLGGTAESYIVTITPSSWLIDTGSIVVTVTPARVNDLAGNTGTPTGSTTTLTVSFAHKIRPTITAVTTATKYVRGPFDVTFDFSEPLLEVAGERDEYEFTKEDIDFENSWEHLREGGDDDEPPSASAPNDPVVDSTDRSRYTVRIVPAGGDGKIKIGTRIHLTYPASSLGVHSKIKDRSGNVLQLSGTNLLPREYAEVFYDVIGPTVKAVLGHPAYESSPGKYTTPRDLYVRHQFVENDNVVFRLRRGM